MEFKSLSNGIRAVGAGEEMACIFCQNGICFKEECKPKMNVIRTSGEETGEERIATRLGELNQALGKNTEQLQHLSESMGRVNQMMDETLKKLDQLLEKEGLLTGSRGDEAETQDGGRETYMKQGFSEESFSSMEKNLPTEGDKERAEGKAEMADEKKKRTEMTREEEADYGSNNRPPPPPPQTPLSPLSPQVHPPPLLLQNHRANTPPPPSLKISYENGPPPSLPSSPTPQSPPPSLTPLPPLPEPAMPPLSSPPPPLWFKYRSESATLNKGGSNQSFRKLKMLSFGSYRPPLSPPLLPPHPQSEFCASLQFGMVTSHKQSTVKITAPLNDGWKDVRLGFRQNGLKIDNRAEINSLGSENLDLTNVTIKNKEKLSPMVVKTKTVTKSAPQSAAISPINTLILTLPVFDSTDDSSTSRFDDGKPPPRLKSSSSWRIQNNCFQILQYCDEEKEACKREAETQHGHLTKENIPPGMLKYRKESEEHGSYHLATSQVMPSTLEDGKRVDGLIEIPKEGPIMLIDNHVLIELDLIIEIQHISITKDYREMVGHTKTIQRPGHVGGPWRMVLTETHPTLITKYYREMVGHTVVRGGVLVLMTAAMGVYSTGKAAFGDLDYAEFELANNSPRSSGSLACFLHILCCLGCGIEHSQLKGQQSSLQLSRAHQGFEKQIRMTKGTWIRGIIEMLSAIFIHLEDKVKVWAAGIDKPWLPG